MINGKKVTVVLPAYNAAKTLERTISEVPVDLIDDIIVVDDGSTDDTALIAARLGVELRSHERNLGYGGNQKTCYRTALARDADVIVMLHPDYQYTPGLLVAIAAPICYGVYDVVLGSRILGGTALAGGMPRVKYVVNRALTFFQNLVFRRKLSEYHTGYRAFHRQVLEALPLERNSNDFVFDSQMLAQVIAWKFRIGEISCPTRYFPEASSIGWGSGVRYAFGCVVVALQYLAHELGVAQPDIFQPRETGPADRPPP